MNTMTEKTVSLKGMSGTTYKYRVYPKGTGFKDAPGNYVFAALSGGKYTLLYIGETGSLETRLTDKHEKVPCCNARGWTHVMAHLGGGKSDRLAEESDLVKNYNPPCNL